jgi:hypothetical protein
MAFSYLTLFTALIISLGAAVYSIIGLTAIFAAAFWPIVIMGGSLEVGKIVATVWLHKYWDRAGVQYKVYLCTAVAILMMLTSMGVFGFLSKAHGDQSLVSGDASAKVAVYDEKIKMEKDNVETNRKALKQMDEAVDQIMARGTTEGSADKSVALRRSQQKERTRLLAEISDSQKKITALNEARAPIAAENRKIEAEVGPVKYIAALIYGDNPEANVLEKAVRWVIILIVVVFDPLALTLLLAATKSLEWERGINIFAPKKRDEEEPKYEPDDGPLTEDQIDQLRTEAKSDLPTGPTLTKTSLFDEDIGRWDDFFNGKKTFQEIERGPQVDVVREELVPDPLPPVTAVEPSAPGWMFTARPTGDITGSEHFGIVNDEQKIIDEIAELTAEETLQATEPLPVEQDDPLTKMAREVMASGNSVEHFNALPLSDGERKRLQQQYAAQAVPTPPADNTPPALGTVTGFGTEFPKTPTRGDLFLRVDALPTVLYKYNGTGWIEVDKALTDTYAYDSAYIDHLIDKISNGAYDPDLLSDAEREQIALKLRDQIK